MQAAVWGVEEKKPSSSLLVGIKLVHLCGKHYGGFSIKNQCSGPRLTKNTCLTCDAAAMCSKVILRGSVVGEAQHHNGV